MDTTELKIIEKVIKVVSTARSTTAFPAPPGMISKGDAIRHILDAFPASKAALLGAR